MGFFSLFYSLFSFFCLNFKMKILYLSHQNQMYDSINHLTHNFIPMNKTELIEKIAAGAGLSKADAKKALDATVDAIKAALTSGEKIQLIGFGTFSVNERPAREGVNPRTGEKVTIAAKKVAKFKAGAELADAVNK